jgi:hypothetical protein
MTDEDLFAAIRSGDSLWHATPSTNLPSIDSAGQISPNDGRFPVTFQQSNNSWSRALGGVSLFAFHDAPEDEFRTRVWDYPWASLKPASVLIEVDPSALDRSRLRMPGELAKDPLLKCRNIGERVYIPYLEAIYLAPVPATAFRSYNLVALRGRQACFWRKIEPRDVVEGKLEAGLAQLTEWQGRA